MYFQMKVAEDSHFFLKVELNAWVVLDLFACSLNYSGCLLVAFKRKYHDHNNLPGGEKAFLGRKKNSPVFQLFLSLLPL